MRINPEKIIKRNEKIIMVFLVLSVFFSVYFFITLSEELYPQYEVIPTAEEKAFAQKLPNWIKIIRENGENKLVDEGNAFKLRVSDNWSILSFSTNTLSIGLFNTNRQAVQQGFKVGVYKDDSSTNLAIWIRNWVVKSECPVCYSAPQKLEENLYNVISETDKSKPDSYFFRKNGNIYEISIFDKTLNIRQILDYFEFVSSSATTTP